MSRSGSFAIIATLAFAAIQSSMSATIPSVVSFWPDVAKNLTLVKWKHAVNSKELLTEALNSKVHMLEADVSLDAESKPVMAHPPNTSDFTLEAFLTQVIEANKANNRKGVKLDFKSLDAFKNSEEILNKTIPKITFPLWLNADILKGPNGEQTTAVNATEFLIRAKNFTGVALSLGWTTKNGTLNTTAEYTEDNINSMLKVVNANVNKTQSVTYAVRAGLLAHTKKELVEKLVKNTDNSTLTVWSGKNDTVDAAKLSEMIRNLDVGKVYLDVPTELEAKLHLNSSASGMRNSAFNLIGSLVISLLLALAVSH